jgi:hypothetical protein
MLSKAKHRGFSRRYEGEILRLRLRMTFNTVSAGGEYVEINGELLG